jgi:hypothetical protein
MVGWAGRGTGNDCRVAPPRNTLNDDGLGAIEGNHRPPTGLLLRLGRHDASGNNRIVEE